MARIGFDDGSGYVNLRGVFYNTTGLLSRFRNWSPFILDVADRATAIGTGYIAACFIYRTDFGAAFELPNISRNGPDGIDMLTVAQRFVRHAGRGRPFDVYVEDGVTAVRTGYAPELPSLVLENRKDMLYTLSVRVIGGGSTQWDALYGGARE